MFRTLIDPSTLAGHLTEPQQVIIDCRSDTLDPAKGAALYAQDHIPGARYVHPDVQLSGQKSGTNGRHPLPDPDALRRDLGLLGIGPGSQVVAYDADNSTYASRLWWLLRWLGHEAVAVLDGGYARWCREGFPVSSGAETPKPKAFQGAPREGWWLGPDQLAKGLHDPAIALIDSRSQERYHGINGPIDPTGGHIPGAVNYFFMRNLTADKTFKSPEELKTQWTAVLDGRTPDKAVVYCGFGITACTNLLALEHAGLPGARLYPGSWSEWSADATRPMATGDHEGS